MKELAISDHDAALRANIREILNEERRKRSAGMVEFEQLLYTSGGVTQSDEIEREPNAAPPDLISTASL